MVTFPRQTKMVNRIQGSFCTASEVNIHDISCTKGTWPPFLSDCLEFILNTFSIREDDIDDIDDLHPDSHKERRIKQQVQEGPDEDITDFSDEER